MTETKNYDEWRFKGKLILNWGKKKENLLLNWGRLSRPKVQGGKYKNVYQWNQKKEGRIMYLVEAKKERSEGKWPRKLG